MLNLFLEKLNDIHALSADLMQSLEKETKILEVEKGQVLLREGEVSNYVTAVLQGMLRSFYYVKDNEEITSRFTTEGEVVLSVNSFYTRKPGYECLMAEEDCIIARISYEQQQEYLKKYMEYNYIVRLFTEKYYAASEEHLFQLRKKPAADKWNFFMETYPHLVQRVPLKHIASFLGMRLETLSRVRAAS